MAEQPSNRKRLPLCMHEGSTTKAAELLAPSAASCCTAEAIASEEYGHTSEVQASPRLANMPKLANIVDL